MTRFLQGIQSKKQTSQSDSGADAYFEVSSNPKRPFIVKTNELDIKVTGTSFNIKAYEEDSEMFEIITREQE